MRGFKFFLALVAASALGGVLVLALAPSLAYSPADSQSIAERQAMNPVNLLEDTAVFKVPEGLNFVYASEQVTPAVVHIRATFRNGYDEVTGLFRDLFPGGRGYRGPSRASGSGVIITDNGYVATNYHVVEDAVEVEVTLNDNRRYYAEVIGTDPTTDLALLKIEEQQLPFVAFGSSDGVRIGEWVLAIGNPFELTSTVTAGIVSAKARSINILSTRQQYGIESFIQTDAVVNRGNSGGALVNLKGELVGINTAIATQSGTYEGYSFAVPVSLVRKVMEDLREYGRVQRALLGVSIRDVDAELAADLGLERPQGVLVLGLSPSSAGADAGLRPDDVLLAIDGGPVNNVPELQEVIGQYRPGETVEVTYWRAGQRLSTKATLKAPAGERQEAVATEELQLEGITFSTPVQEELEALEINGGAKVTQMAPGPWEQAGVREGFIITHMDKRSIADAEDLARRLRSRQGVTLIEGMYADGSTEYYTIDGE